MAPYQSWKLTGGKIQIVQMLLLLMGEIVHCKYCAHKWTPAQTHIPTHTHLWVNVCVMC